MTLSKPVRAQEGVPTSQKLLLVKKEQNIWYLWPFFAFLGHKLQHFGMNGQGAEVTTPARAQSYLTWTS